MSLFWAIAFGGLGLRFGTLGAVRGAGTAAPAGPTPMMRFNDEANSQLLAALEDF